MLVDIQMYPRRLKVHHPIPLLQKEDVGGDFCAGGTLEGVVGQADRT